MTSKASLTALLLTFTGTTAFALIPGLTLEQKIKESDLIVRVNITAADNRKQEATATIAQVYKGRNPNRSIVLSTEGELGMLYGLSYAKGESCIVFLKQKKPGVYTTVGSITGKALVTEDSGTTTMVDGEAFDLGRRPVPLKDALDLLTKKL